MDCVGNPAQQIGCYAVPMTTEALTPVPRPVAVDRSHTRAKRPSTPGARANGVRLNPAVSNEHYEKMLAWTKEHRMTWGEVIEALIDEFEGKPTPLSRGSVPERIDPPFFGIDP